MSRGPRTAPAWAAFDQGWLILERLFRSGSLPGGPGSKTREAVGLGAAGPFPRKGLIPALFLLSPFLCSCLDEDGTGCAYTPSTLSERVSGVTQIDALETS